MRAYFWYVIGTIQGCWLNDKEASLGYYCIDDKGLISASHHYAKVVARWLEALASYAG